MVFDLESAIKRLEETPDGVLLAEELSSGAMGYVLWHSEIDAFQHYMSDQHHHSVIYPSHPTRLFFDWEINCENVGPADATTLVKTHKASIRKLTKAVDSMMVDCGCERFTRWLVENRSRPSDSVVRISFHLYSDIWCVNVGVVRVFALEAARRAGCTEYLDRGVYRPKGLLRIAGSSKPGHKLPGITDQDDFAMCLLSSMMAVPDVGTAELAAIGLELPQKPKREYDSVEEDIIMSRLQEHGETITHLVPHESGAFYGEGINGRCCLSVRGITHKPKGNRCVVWASEGQLWYRCLDPDHDHVRVRLGRC